MDAVSSVVPWLSLWASVARRASTGTVDCCLWSTSVRFLIFPACTPTANVSGGTDLACTFTGVAGVTTLNIVAS